MNESQMKVCGSDLSMFFLRLFGSHPGLFTMPSLNVRYIN